MKVNISPLKRVTRQLSACLLLQVLTFAALQLTLTEAQKEHLSAPVVTTRRLGVSTHSIGKARSALSMAPATMRQLLDIFFISAQQFQGYVSEVDNEEV